MVAFRIPSRRPRISITGVMQLVVQLVHETMRAARSARLTPRRSAAWAEGRNVTALDRRGEDDELRAGVDMTLEIRLPGEDARALQDDRHPEVTPGQLVQALLVQRDAGSAVDDEAATLCANVTPVAAIHGVVTEQ